MVEHGWLKMKKTKIFLYHFLVFIAGSIGLVVYVFKRLTSLSGGAGLGGVIVMPVMILIYVIVFGILCIISYALFVLVSHLRNRARK